ncbi:MAG: class I SAM-dependent methyltransferase [Ignavibacteriales bacterium]|nr:class I SAM-dependent methyltransferase [Ignavibacteriales bacterium]
MKNYEQYFDANKKLWNKRVDINFNSKFYANDEFKKTKISLNSIELNELGNISGKNILHLQCHFGQDTLSLANLGASVTGVDFSEEAITKAKQLSKDLNLQANFICSNIYDLKEKLDEKFDIIFTSYGTIGWLPDIKKWANIVSHFLKPEGEFIIAEFHPFIWMLDNNFEKIKYPYFHTDEPIEETISGTYADNNAKIEMVEYGWNHSISDVINSLINEGMEIKSFNEFCYSPYNCFPNMIEMEKGKFIFEKFKNILPIVYSIKAEKRLK